MFKHSRKFITLVLQITTMLIRERPTVMIMAIVLLFVSANLDALGILLMAYPFSTLPKGEGSVELMLGDTEFRTTVALCFAGAILMFFTGATIVVWSMTLAVSTGRQTALPTRLITC